MDFPVGPDAVLFSSQLSRSSQLHGGVFNYSRLDLHADKGSGARFEILVSNNKGSPKGLAIC